MWAQKTDFIYLNNLIDNCLLGACVNEYASVGTLQSVNTWWLTWTEWIPRVGVGLAQVLLLPLAFLLS